LADETIDIDAARMPHDENFAGSRIAAQLSHKASRNRVDAVRNEPHLHPISASHLHDFNKPLIYLKPQVLSSSFMSTRQKTAHSQ
jgi:hypothetical protein